VIQIIDYRAGNLRSVKKALDHLGIASEITCDPDVVSRADMIALPGVGHFSSTAYLTRTGLRDAVREAIRRGAPFLGICVGMQWLFEGSEESPETPGLGLFSGSCSRFREGLKIPHVGWNSIDFEKPSRLLTGVASGSAVYYTHSYRAPAETAVATTDYDGPFAAAIERENVFGVQFHPEKSGAVGLQILENFGAMSC
jgi:glutamine amidotransferase